MPFNSWRRGRLWWRTVHFVWLTCFFRFILILRILIDGFEIEFLVFGENEFFLNEVAQFLLVQVPDAEQYK